MSTPCKRKQPRIDIKEALEQYKDHQMIEEDVQMMIYDHDCLFCCSPGLEELLPLSADIYSNWIDSWNN